MTFGFLWLILLVAGRPRLVAAPAAATNDRATGHSKQRRGAQRAPFEWSRPCCRGRRAGRGGPRRRTWRAARRVAWLGSALGRRSQAGRRPARSPSRPARRGRGRTGAGRWRRGRRPVAAVLSLRASLRGSWRIVSAARPRSPKRSRSRSDAIRSRGRGCFGSDIGGREGQGMVQCSSPEGACTIRGATAAVVGDAYESPNAVLDISEHPGYYSGPPREGGGRPALRLRAAREKAEPGSAPSLT
jgi:hypothetical protein